jgi:uncharacterized protein (TIGR02117 family)
MYPGTLFKSVFHPIDLLCFFILSCNGNSCAQPSISDSLKSVYIVSHGWHTSIIIHRSDLPDTLWPISIDFSEEDSLEIGWGDKVFYMSNDFNFFTALKAAILPTESVLHVVAFSESIINYFNYCEIIKLEIYKTGYQQMCSFIYRSFKPDSTGKAMALGRGLYGNSQFFLGKKKYYYPNTCNSWTAEALYRAGIHIYPKRYQFAKDLMGYLKKIGKIINIPKD